MIAFGGCDSAFSPNGPYQERMVAYAILSTHSDTQFVNLYTTRPLATSFADSHVSDAQVIITEGNNTFPFRDTTIQRVNATGDTLRLGAYVCYALHLNSGLRYGLSVSSPSHGNLSAQGRSLYRATVLLAPDPSGNFGVRVFPGVYARAYVLRMFLDYAVMFDSIGTPGRLEIPENIDGSGNPQYPEPVSRDIAYRSFDLSGFQNSISRLRQQFAPTKVRLLKTAFVLTELDSVLYAYYNTVNGFPDSGTLRLDEPDYTNIQGGLGIFAMTAETIVIADTAGHQTPTLSGGP